MNTPELHWFKSSYSDSGDINDCVEVAIAPSAIHVRDSKNKPGAQVTLSTPVWGEFVAYVSK
ncbi:DUF397 domain-containing protein [Streptomyces sp. NPDC101776]|uniref:DUF397 domain-containing protein n=1 Tax=Streptomyces sp. NPDC101776 TaxID=3366146 RepID=UPI0038205CE9